jgi:hypothetical protein
VIQSAGYKAQLIETCVRTSGRTLPFDVLIKR